MFNQQVRELTGLAGFLHQPVDQLVAHLDAHVSKHELQLCRRHHAILIPVQQVKCSAQI